jgi:RNA polymerase primary sigma factor
MYVYIYILQAISKVFSLDREAFPSLNGLPGDTYHNVSFNTFSTTRSRTIIGFRYFLLCLYPKISIVSFCSSFRSQFVADKRIENIPWNGVDEWALKVISMIYC